jgi:hypothetical protein
MWGTSDWSNVQTVTIYPLSVGLNLSWDGTGYFRGSDNNDVGYHVTRNIDQLPQSNRIRSNDSIWFDPNPYNWDPSYGFSYFAVTSGVFLSSTVPTDPALKWGEPWVLPYSLQLHHGQIVTIDDQDFLVSGPFTGLTVFGASVRYWEFVNQQRFLFWDGGGDLTQYVEIEGVVLWYDAGNTRLELSSDILRHVYYQGNLTADTIQYTINLTAANSFP